MLSEKIAYVGCDDRKIDLFEGQYPVPDGISYNSYVISDEKIVVMDTVDSRKCSEFISNLRNLFGQKKPDYVVVSHVEPDHASSLEKFMEIYPETTVVGNAKTFQLLSLFFPEAVDSWKKMTVKEGDQLVIGSIVLQFVLAPMVHWPEVMMTWLPQERTLFSADAFGTFACHDGNGWESEARRYYCNIVGKYGAQVLNTLKKLSALDVETICPLHGPVVEENIGRYIGLYEKWAGYEPENKDAVMIAYASLHGNTGKAAEIMKTELNKSGVHDVKVLDLCRCNESEAIAEGFRCGKWVLMSSTYNAALVPAMDNFIRLAASKGLQNRKIALGENGLWAPNAVKNMTALLQTMKNMTIIEGKITIKGAVKEENLSEIQQLAKVIAES